MKKSPARVIFLARSAFSRATRESVLFFHHAAFLARQREYAFMYFFFQRERKSTKKNAAVGCSASAPVSLPVRKRIRFDKSPNLKC